MIPYSTQSINEDDIRAVSKVLRSAYLTQGPAVAAFERAIAKYTGAKYCVAFSSGTTALHAAYSAAGIGKGDEVIVPPLTFAATCNAALYLGARPVFADIDPAYGTMSIEDARAKITKHTKALVPVDYGGRPSDVRELKALAKQHKLVLIIDGAQSFGARYRGKPVGADADMTTFSFHPVKSITTGEGGAVTTGSEKFYRKLLLFRHHGISKDPKAFVRKRMPAWYQEMQELGFNYRLTDIQAALGESQMKRLDRFIAARRRLAGRYRTLLQDIPGIILPPAERAHERSAWHLYPIRLAGKFAGKRDKVFSALRNAGIGVQAHHLPVYLHVYYRKLGYAPGLCPEAERFFNAEISLPLYPGLSRKEQDFVAHTLRAVLGKI